MTGEWRNTIDEKGRLIIPPKCRAQMGGLSELYITRSAAHSVWLFTKEGYQRMAEKINADPLGSLNSNVVLIKRIIIDPARQVELDKAGRVSIPQILREYAKIELKTECVILGSNDRLEICSAKEYDQYVLDNLSKLSEAGNAISKIG